MNRRHFLSTLLKGAATISILPAATTYARHWRLAGVDTFRPNPAYVTVPGEYTLMIDEYAYRCINIGPPPANIQNFRKDLASGLFVIDPQPTRYTFDGETLTAHKA